MARILLSLGWGWGGVVHPLTCSVLGCSWVSPSLCWKRDRLLCFPRRTGQSLLTDPQCFYFVLEGRHLLLNCSRCSFRGWGGDDYYFFFFLATLCCYHWRKLLSLVDFSVMVRGGGSSPFWLRGPFLLVVGKVFVLMQRGWGHGLFCFLFPRGTNIHICKDYLLLALLSLPAAACFSYANAVSSELGCAGPAAPGFWGPGQLPEIPQLREAGSLVFIVQPLPANAQ